MSNPIGSFIWYELMTTDSDAAASFYRSVISWDIGNRPDAAPGGTTKLRRMGSLAQDLPYPSHWGTWLMTQALAALASPVPSHSTAPHVSGARPHQPALRGHETMG